MKLRFTCDEVRLRLDRSDLETFRSTGRVAVTTPIAPKTTFTFALERDAEVKAPAARLSDSTLTVLLPPSSADAWAASDEVGLETEQDTGADTALHILVEKDLGCVHKEGEEENTFDDLADATF